MTLTDIAPARRSHPESFRTTAMPSTMTAPLTASVPTPSRRVPWLVAVATLGVAAAAVTVVIGSGGSSVDPLPEARVSLIGADPTASGCSDDARTLTSRVLTAQRGRFEVPIGMLEVRGSARCGTAWARYTVNASAPVSAVAIEGAPRQEVPLVTTGRVAHGVTPMVDADPSVHAEVVPAAGADLPSRQTDPLPGGTS
ncbi:DUF2690 domain-containing protein [Actinomycetospora atypica]|uniref:DUF2690 domain-containing protein n=1 Tax=Actinomycetospora atypica TaxID=1290095 RepID=A0ABV9YFK2_9PSEU